MVHAQLRIQLTEFCVAAVLVEGQIVRHVRCAVERSYGVDLVARIDGRANDRRLRSGRQHREREGTIGIERGPAIVGLVVVYCHCGYDTQEHRVTGLDRCGARCESWRGRRAEQYLILHAASLPRAANSAPRLVMPSDS